jgi:RNA polymerase sigma-70 factor (ECF subfamily)
MSISLEIAQQWLFSPHEKKGRGMVQKQEAQCPEDALPNAPNAAHTLSLSERQRAFSSFFTSRQERFLGIAYRILRDREAALDVLQDVALRLYQHWEALDQQKNIDGWIYRVTLHACYRWLRQQPPAAENQDSLAFEREASRPLQEAHLRTREFQRFLADALEELSEQERIAYILRDLEGCDGKEIAAIMGCQGTTARGYYFAARKKLSTYIQQHAPEWMSLLGKGDDR